MLLAIYVCRNDYKRKEKKIEWIHLYILIHTYVYVFSI